MAEPKIPATTAEALDPAWLTEALASFSGGARVTTVETVEIIKTVATKIRFAVTFDNGRRESLCVKGLLDRDPDMARGGSVTILETEFYEKLAAKLDVRVPECVATIINRDEMFGIFIMRDLIVQGARFCSALEPFNVDQAAASLDQLAHLHAGRSLLAENSWIQPRVEMFTKNILIPIPTLQEMLNGRRSEGLPSSTANATSLMQALTALAALDAGRPQFLIHGDCHAGNIFRTAEGPGLIDWQLLQRGGWALDVSYHVCAVLPVELAEREERTLLDHYLATMKGLGCNMPDRDAAWADYRASVVWGYYLWAITRRVEPAITNMFNQRLGSAVTRHDSYRLLGL